MSENLRRSTRVNAGRTNYFDGFVRHNPANSRPNHVDVERVQSESNLDMSRLEEHARPSVEASQSESNHVLLYRPGSMEQAEVSNVSANGDGARPMIGCTPKMSADRCSQTKSQRSKTSSKRVVFEKRRLALEAEVARTELRMKQQELENQMRILELQTKLAENKIDEEEETSSRESVVEDIGETRMGVDVQDWIDKYTVYSNANSPCKSNQEVKSSMSQENDNLTKENDNLSKLCNVIADAIKTVSSKHIEFPDGVSQQRVDKDFPYFDGRSENWPLFISQFNRKMSMYKYSEDELTMQLQKCLKGEAMESVRSLLLHPKNNAQVIETLEMRFGRPEYVIGSLINKVQVLPVIRDGDFNSLIKFSCHVNNLVATLENFEADNHLGNPFLLEQLAAKIPNSLKLQWGQIIAQRRGKVTLKEFGTWTNEVSSAACYVSPKTLFNNSSFTSQKKYHHGSRTENVMIANSQINKVECLYCDQLGHNISDCSMMKSDNVDERWAKVTKLKICFCCLKSGHHKNNCKSKQRCGHDGCKMRHHVLLHKITKSSSGEEQISKDESIERVCLANADCKVLLRILPIKIYGPNSCLNTYALFDEGSTVSLLESKVAEELGLTGQNKPLCMQWANSIVSYNEESQCIDMNVSGVHDGARMFEMRGVRTVLDLSLPSQTVILDNFKNCSHLQGLPIQDLIDAKPTVLIGQDNIHLTVARKVYQGHEKSPVATKSVLGWAIHGNVLENNVNSHNFNFHICDCSKGNDLDRLVKESFSIDAFGVSVTNKQINASHRRALDILENTTKYLKDEKRYETGLIWRKDDLVLPESKSNAYNRLLCIERKMSKNKLYFNQYCQKLEDYLKKGYIRKLSDDEINVDIPRVWYLPHFGVVNPNKPDKLRLVFDAAAKSHGTSLNDNLLQGPDYLSSLPGVLMRFRRSKWGFCGDIAEMFHQVKIRKEDRCAQRFLWRNGITNVKVDVYELQVMMFGASCSPCSAQYVKNLNAVQSSFPELSEDVEQNFYVDDYLDSCPTEQEAIDKIDKMIRLHRDGGFNIVGWSSNSSLVSEKYGIKHSEKGFNKSTSERVLGIWWNVKNDEFIFKTTFHKIPVEIVKGQAIPTKRQVLKLIMSIFDPLGFLNCLTIKGRILLQQVWRSGIGWDDSIPSKIHDSWLKWLKYLELVSSLHISRCYSPFLSSSLANEIHIFCDASEEAFAAIAYLRIVLESHVDISFILAKARVAPLKPISIPKLELQAAVMGSRLLKTISNEIHIPISDAYLWSDSRTVLYWIRGDGRNYKQFVAHRVGEIQEATVSAHWRYVPTKLNVADEATRFSNSDNEIMSSRWLNGPDFLRKSDDWPAEVGLDDLELDDESERKSIEHFMGFISSHFDHVPDVTRFSKWKKFIRSLAWVLKFCRCLLVKIGRSEKRQIFEDLTLEEINEAKRLCLIRCQEESFERDIKQLREKGQVERSSRLFKLSPFVDDDGLLKMQSRICHALCLSDSVKKPIILDPKNNIVSLLISYYHEKCHHQGKEMILNELRQEYWVIKGRQAIKSSFKRCQYCKVKKAKADTPRMGDLPEIRLTPGVKPFTFAGIDYFGPLFVTVGRHREKRWGVLFTCMTIRAIHLEIANSLTTDSTIMAIRRMISRRGPIRHLYSDNGTNFKGANEELTKLYKELDTKRMSIELTEMEIQWHFIPPITPNMGGCWERLIGSVKKILQVTLHENAPKDEVLHTLFVDAENIVNSRPLTHVSVDPCDPQCLTPNHLLIGSSSVKIPFPTSFEEQDLRKQWKKSQMLADIFWSRWIREYLPTLSRRAKWNRDGKPVAVGDVVVVADGTLPRNSWPLGKITTVFPGRDNIVRVVEVRTSTGLYKRPVTKICRLDVEGEDSNKNVHGGENVTE